MTAPLEATNKRPSRWLLGAAGAIAVGAAAWLILTLYTSPDVRECQRRYAAARTAADTTAVDTLVPGRGFEAHSCVVMRSAARWQ